MKKLREFGVFAAIGFLLGTLGQIGFWKWNVNVILVGYNWIPFVLTPVFAFFSAWLMVGKVSFHYFSEVDNDGNKAYNTFILVALIMLVLSFGIAFEAVSEA